MDVLCGHNIMYTLLLSKNILNLVKKAMEILSRHPHGLKVV